VRGAEEEEVMRAIAAASVLTLGVALAQSAEPNAATSTKPAATPSAMPAAAPNAKPASAAEPQAAPAAEKAEAAEASFEVLAAKLTSGVQEKEPVDEKTSFTTGERGYLWLKIQPKRGEAMLRLRWSRNGEPVWTMEPVPARLGRLWYYKTFDLPGEWKVEVLDDGDKVVYAATLSVTGEAPKPVATDDEPAAVAAARPAKAEGESAQAKPAQPAAKPAGAEGESARPVEVAASAHLEVVDLKLAKDIDAKSREPLEPSSTFAVGSKVYAFVKLLVKDPETSVRFKWYQGDALVYTSQPQSIKQSPEWRTWAYKTADKSGLWKVQIVDAEDKPVQSEEFSVQ
jgi:hypothetical protein